LILADDHHLLVESLHDALSNKFTVVGVVHDGETLLELLPVTEADCLLLDIGLPGRNGLELLPDIRRMRPALKVLIVTQHLDRILADAVIQAGANGFIPKDSGLEELETAIGEVLAGKRYLSPRVPPRTQKVGLGAMHPAFAQLTPRQQEIMRLIGDGKSTADIAQITGLSQRTVGFHRSNIRKVLGIDSELGLARQALLFRMAEEQGPQH
ncbi:MAG TPA: response regulator transcription factor, partial [Gemmatimonadales bacterium]